MNKTKLKSYAPQARLDFIAAVTARANLLGLSEKAGQFEVAPAQTQGDVTLIAGQAWPAKVAAQREQLVVRMYCDGFSKTCEAVAYTWFNRFAALRYMELHDYLGHGHRALSSSDGGLPDILTYATDLAHAGDTGLPGLKAELVTEMKIAGNRDGELYRMLLVAQCNALSRAMPFLFERIDDDSELLLPDNLLRSDSVIAKLVNEIPEEDWSEVEIIGWLYQFYISDKKDQVIGKVVKSEDIPAATQLFTPNWIVQYIVQNSVGRLWMLANPTSALAREWPYYITPAEQTPEVQDQLDALIKIRVSEDGDTLNPESISVLDPACGSGHILVVAYDVLKSIYLERGFQPRAIPRLILERNLFGLDIDDRAAQMAAFALIMKARADDRRLFNEPVKLNILSFQESKGLDINHLTRALQAIVDSDGMGTDAYEVSKELVAHDLFPESHLQGSLIDLTSENRIYKKLKATIAELIMTFDDAKTFGSLILVPKQLIEKLLWFKELLNLAHQKGDLYAKSAARDLLPLVIQAEMLGMRFDAVVANPPYMGNKYLAPALKIYLKEHYAGFEKDLFSAFMIRNLTFSKESGELGFMSPFVWMFISSYEELRKVLLNSSTLTSLIQLEYSGFEGATVPICTFTLSKSHFEKFTGSYIRLSDFRGSEIQGQKSLEAIRNPSCSWFYIAKADDFKKIPGAPIAYWASKEILQAFLSNKLGDSCDLKIGLQTGDTDRFIRYWYEINIQNSSLKSFGGTLKSKWVLLNKAGGFRKWYGNNENVVNWARDGEDIKKCASARPQNINFYFKSGVTWGLITSDKPSARFMPEGMIFDVSAPTLFSTNAYQYLGYLNSSTSLYLLSIINPTLNLSTGSVGVLPDVEIKDFDSASIAEAIEISKYDWDSFENSWDFISTPLISNQVKKNTLKASWESWKNNCIERILKMKYLEEKNNRTFIKAYGLQDELSAEVPESQITLANADREKDCQRLVSYAIGCMMGRYSLDKPGLIYAHDSNTGFDSGRYTTFLADTDGIVPITDELWFDEDASSRIREFLSVAWGAEILEENMTWLAESLGSKSDETSDETIRRYIADKFFKDHLQTYKKRPIYWLFSSGKQGAFQALVYLHRYNEGTLARMRAEYVVPLTSKIQSRIEMLEKDVNAASSTPARNKLAKEVEKLKKKHVELLAYDQQLRHYADMRITLDLDDGVKVNYGKFGDLLAEVKAVTGGTGDE